MTHNEIAAPQDGGGSQPVDCEHQEGYVAANLKAELTDQNPGHPTCGAAPYTPPTNAITDSKPGRIPALEPTRINADYWFKAGQNERSIEAVAQCLMQSINAWKNAAYAAHDELARSATERKEKP